MKSVVTRLSSAEDVVLLRRSVRSHAEALGLGDVERTKLAAAVSEVARYVLSRWSRALGKFTVDGLELQVEIEGLGSEHSPKDAVSSARLPSIGGQVTLGERSARLVHALPHLPDPQALRALEALADGISGDPLEELRQQNLALVSALEQTRRVEEQLALAVATADLGTIAFIDDRIEANARALRMHGVEAMTSLAELEVSIEEGWEALSVQLAELRHGRIGLLEVDYRTTSGRAVLMRGQRELGNANIHATLLDVTRQKEEEKQAQERAETQEMMMRVASHDLRSPLQTIQTGIALLHELIGDDPMGAKVLSRVNDASAQAARLVGDFLDYTQVQVGGRLPLNLEVCDLRELADAAANAVALKANAEVRVEGPPVRLQADPSRITQAVTNLVDNAAHHRAPDTPVDVALHRDPEGVRLTVSNQGEPIPAELLPRVFEPFRRGSKTSRAGLGLGLHIVRMVAEAHGGSAEVRSDASGHTSFEIRIPL